MAPRRVVSRGDSSTPTSQPRTRGGIRKNTRQRQPPNRYGVQPEPSTSRAESERTLAPSSTSQEPQPSTPQYSHSPSSNLEADSPTPPPTRTARREAGTLPSASLPDSSPLSLRTPDGSINLETMRDLLRSHQQEIVDCVILQLNTQNAAQIPIVNHHHEPQQRAQTTQAPQPNSTLTRIEELEAQLSRLRGETTREQTAHQQRRGTGMYDPIPISTVLASESASPFVHSVEVLFPGVERSTLVQIIENRFKPTNIYRLLASEKDRAESQRTISIGGVEFEQAERDGKECEYRMSAFFKAWAAYTGILVQLAPHGLQGELATALSIYTMNLYDLLEKYTWDGVKGYHFQFHRKRVASGTSIYQPADWRQLDSELVASKCFAYPAPRPAWTHSQKQILPTSRRIYELPIRDNLLAPSHQQLATHPSNSLTQLERRISYSNTANTSSFPPIGSTGITAPTTQTCRNWNYRECRSTQCRYHHACINCGGNHRGSTCTSANSGPGYQTRNGPHSR